VLGEHVASLRKAGDDIVPGEDLALSLCGFYTAEPTSVHQPKSRCMLRDRPMAGSSTMVSRGARASALFLRRRRLSEDEDGIDADGGGVGASHEELAWAGYTGVGVGRAVAEGDMVTGGGLGVRDRTAEESAGRGRRGARREREQERRGPTRKRRADDDGGKTTKVEREANSLALSTGNGGGRDGRCCTTHTLPNEANAHDLPRGGDEPGGTTTTTKENRGPGGFSPVASARPPKEHHT
jgi:hypothetical protein